MINSAQKNMTYNWLFHFNKHTDKWYGFPRDEYAAYFNGVAKNAVSAETIEQCMQYASEKEMQLRIEAAKLRDK